MRLLAERLPEFAEKLDEVDEVYLEKRSTRRRTSSSASHCPSGTDRSPAS